MTRRTDFAFHPPVRGRGASENPAGRFEKLDLEISADAYEEALLNQEEESAQGQQIKTEVFKDTTKSIISTNDSPDVGMEATVNPYRGCEHGCIYCYARPTHEYFGLSAGLDFETKLFAKTDAPLLLEQKLSSKGWVPKVVTFSGVTDPYQPLEKTMEITRQCFRVLADFRNPAAIITKNHMVMRDIDIFTEMAGWTGISVNLSITTLESSLSRAMEPRASQPHLRLRAVEAMAKAGVRVGIMIGPVLPGLTEHEIPAILKSAADAGAQAAYYTMLRLPYGVKDLFQRWLQDHYPDRAEKVLHRVEEVRGGKLNDAHFGSRMRGTGLYADHIAHMMKLYKRKYGLDRPRPPLSTASFRRKAPAGQLSLFEGM